MPKRSKKTSKKKNRKSQTDDLFSSGKPSSGFMNLPSSTYEGFIKPGSAVIEPKDSGGHKASLTLVVTAPEEFEGKEQTMRCDLSTQVGVDIFLGQLVNVLGFDQPSSAKETAEILEETDKMKVRFWVGPEQGEFPPKVRLNELLEDSDEDSDSDSSDEEGAPDFEKGDRVSAEIDDETYEGTIKKVIDDEAVVLFDDGDKQTIDCDDLTRIDEED